jgi:hypothetical protein
MDFCFLFVERGESGLLGWACGATLPDLRPANLAGIWADEFSEPALRLLRPVFS